jgi:hypothetical protein
MKSFNHYAYGACGEWQSYCEHGILSWALHYTDLAPQIGGTTPDFLFGHLRRRSYLDEEAALVEEIKTETALLGVRTVSLWAGRLSTRLGVRTCNPRRISPQQPNPPVVVSLARRQSFGAWMTPTAAICVDSFVHEVASSAVL